MDCDPLSTDRTAGVNASYAVFFAPFTFAHRALCAATIFRRAATESLRLPRIVTTLFWAFAFSRTFAQRALCAAAIRARAAAENLPLLPVCFPYALAKAASATPIPRSSLPQWHKGLILESCYGDFLAHNVLLEVLARPSGGRGAYSRPASVGERSRH